MSFLRVFCVVSFLLSGCASLERPAPEQKEGLIPLSVPIAIALVDDSDRDSLRLAIAQSLTYLQKISPERIYHYGPYDYTAAEVVDSLKTFERLLEGIKDTLVFSKRVRKEFLILQGSGSDGNGTVLYTGYYEPILEGSRTRTQRFAYPIYGKPKDLLEIPPGTFKSKYEGEKWVGRLEGSRMVPYYTRREIDGEGVLSGRHLEILWLEDPVDLFFLQVQGSGQIRLPDGQIVRVNYTASNGRPYRSIGRLLVEEGVIPEGQISLQRLRGYLKGHPEERNRILFTNERYIFFREVEKGPLGSLEVPLTGGRSIATDHRFFPPGGLAFIRSMKPVIDSEGTIRSWEPFSRFVLNQDTGGAIKGPGRVDLFWGNGQEAEMAAGHLQHPGTLYFLIKRKVKQVATFSCTKPC
jgi:membrane-bound lytic murein transglycosylase A